MNAKGHYPGPLAAFLIALGAWLATGIIISLLLEPGQEDIGIALLGFGEVLGLGIVSSLATRSVPEPQSERLGLRGFPRSWLLALVLLLPMTILMSELLNLAHALFPPPDAQAVAERMAARLQTSTALDALETVIVVVGLAPIVEEFLYRGVLQQGLVAHLGRFGGVFAAACLFGLSHLQVTLSAASSLATFVALLPFGILLGAVRLATGSIVASMLLHAGYNAISLLGLVLAEDLPISGFNAPGAHTPVLLLLVCAALVGIALARVIPEARAAPMALPLPETGEEDDEAGPDLLP